MSIQDTATSRALQQRKKREDFLKELAGIINRYSMENGSNTPDFILAEHLLTCLEVFDATSRRREGWYGKSLSIGGGELSAGPSGLSTCHHGGGPHDDSCPPGGPR